MTKDPDMFKSLMTEAEVDACVSILVTYMSNYECGKEFTLRDLHLSPFSHLEVYEVARILTRAVKCKILKRELVVDGAYLTGVFYTLAI